MKTGDKLGMLGIGVLMGVAFLFIISGPTDPKQPTVVHRVDVEQSVAEGLRRVEQAKAQSAEEFYESKVTVIMPRTYIKDINASISIIRLPNGDCYMLTRGSDNVVVTPVNNNMPLLIGTPP